MADNLADGLAPLLDSGEPLWTPEEHAYLATFLQNLGPEAAEASSRKSLHTRAEQKRRSRIKGQMGRLQGLVPRLRGVKCSQATVLQEVGNCIEELRRQNAFLLAHLRRAVP